MYMILKKIHSQQIYTWGGWYVMLVTLTKACPLPAGLSTALSQLNWIRRTKSFCLLRPQGCVYSPRSRTPKRRTPVTCNLQVIRCGWR